jgi:hypothetical protein
VTSFQFDECSSAKSFIKSCNDQKLCVAVKYPKKLKGKKDPEMLDVCMQTPNVLLTFDLTICETNLSHIPEQNPGIVMVGHSLKIPYTMTVNSATKIVGAFKQHFPEWHAIPWNNSLVRITDESVEVAHRTVAGIVPDFYSLLSESGWQEVLKATLTHNSAGPA